MPNVMHAAVPEVTTLGEEAEQHWLEVLGSIPVPTIDSYLMRFLVCCFGEYAEKL